MKTQQYELFYHFLSHRDHCRFHVFMKSHLFKKNTISTRKETLNLCLVTHIISYVESQLFENCWAYTFY